MTDKKLTDNEIIKALDICSKSTNGCSHSKYTCEDCYLNGQPMCSSVLLQDAIDLHARQQAKIEEFMKETAVTTLIDDAVVYTPTLEDYYKFKKKFKSEAVKEFAERLKDTLEHAYQFEYGYLISKDVINAKIDNLVKEMVGENNATT